MARLPLPPDHASLRQLLRGEDVRVVPETTRISRIFTARSTHSQFWNAFRSFGPLPHARFDPHEPGQDGGPSQNTHTGVLYFGLSVRTSIAEVFQTTSTVDRVTKGPHLVVLRPRRPLRLLDLSGLWPTRAGASQGISSGPKSTTHQWARAIRAAYPDLDGLWYRSSMDSGEPAMCLWSPQAADALPAQPDFLAPLNHPGLDVPLGRVCEQLGYVLLT